VPGISTLRFRLSRSGIEVHARSEVRYCLPGVGIGVEFIGLSPEYLSAIEQEIAGTPVIGYPFILDRLSQCLG
jgi:hypothetical protein